MLLTPLKAFSTRMQNNQADEGPVSNKVYKTVVTAIRIRVPIPSGAAGTQL